MTTHTRDLPAGTVTFFFSDVQDSTGLLQRLATGYREVLERHAEIIRGCLTAHDGIEVSTEGDSFFAVFLRVPDAVAAAGTIQQRLAAEAWPVGGTVAVRIGLHTGTAQLGFDNYVGLDVNRAARISAAGHGGQVVVSETVKTLAPDAAYSDLGEHILKGVERLEHLYQLDIPGLPQTFPPLRTRSVRPNNLPALVGLHLAASAGGSAITTVDTLPELLAWRFLQALGGGACVVNSAAIVRDCFQGREAAKVMSTMAMIMMLAPLAAPAVGSGCLA